MLIVLVVFCRSVVVSYLTGKQAAGADEAGMMQQDAEYHPVKTNDDGQLFVKSDARVSLSHFTFIKVLGKGSFGKVRIKPIVQCRTELNVMLHYSWHHTCSLDFLRVTASMLSAHMLSQFRLCLSVCPSVCLSVTWVIHAKTVEVRIMQFSPHSSPIPLVFVR